jgi:predicted Co/Zn/Cd cation transporter (cation efflux family)
MAMFEARANRTIRSDFVALDIKSWLMSAGITAALLIAFCIGFALEGTNLDWLTPYVDPAVLALVCLIIIPIPLKTIRQALSEVLLATPTAMREHVDKVAHQTVEKYGFSGHHAYVAKVGRGKQIELFFVVPKGLPAKPLEEWDKIRDEIGDSIGEHSRDRWLTIAFTTDVEWAIYAYPACGSSL